MTNARRNLWAPWRMEYIRGPKAQGCVFCLALASGEDRENLVVRRGLRVSVVLNRYPYGSGHLLVLPNRHVAGAEDLTAEESGDLWQTMVRCKLALDGLMHPEGYNAGLNLGSAAGAGIAQHLHLHLVPRWVGDTNFMPVLGDTRVVSQHLLELYDALAPALAD